MKKLWFYVVVLAALPMYAKDTARASILQTDVVPFVPGEDQDEIAASLTDEIATTESLLDQEEQAIESLSDELVEPESLLDSVESEAASLTDELGAADSLLDQAGQIVDSLTDRLGSIDSLIDQAELDVESLTDELDITNSLLDRAEFTIESLTDELGATESLLDVAEFTVDSLNDDLGTTDSLLDQAEFVVESLTDEIAVTDSLIDQAEQDVTSLIDELGTTESLLDQAEFAVESLTDELGTVDSLLDQAEFTVESLSDELFEMPSLIDDAEMSIDSLVDGLGTTDSLLDQAEFAVESLTDELGTMDSLLDQAEFKVESLTDDLVEADSLIDQAEELLHDDSIPTASSIDALASLCANTSAFDGVNPDTGLVDRLTSGLNPYLQAALLKLGVVTNVTVAAGEAHTVVLSDDGALYGCGDNTYGQLSMSDLATTYTDVLREMEEPAGGFSGTPIAIAAGWSHTVVLTDNGSLYACGFNDFGQLGIAIGDTTDRYVLTEVAATFTGTPIAVAAGAYHTIILTDENTLYACGRNTYGQLGIAEGDTTRREVLTAMTVPASGTPTEISAGYAHTVVLTDNTLSPLYACGYNLYGQLGDNSTTTRTVLTAMIMTFTGMPTAIAAAESHTVILTDEGLLYSCGRNEYGQLGIDDLAITSTNLLVDVAVTFTGLPQAMTTGYNNTFVLTDAGLPYACGRNNYGQLGVGDAIDKKALTEMINPGFIGTPSLQSGGYNHTVVLTDGVLLYACGYNNHGQLGVGDMTTTTTEALEVMSPNLKINVGFALL